MNNLLTEQAVQYKLKAEITVKQLLDIINRYIFVPASVKEQIFTDLGLKYEKKLDPKPTLEYFINNKTKQID